MAMYLKQAHVEKKLSVLTFKGDEDSRSSNHFIAADCIPRGQAGQSQEDEQGPHSIQLHGEENLQQPPLS